MSSKPKAALRSTKKTGKCPAPGALVAAMACFCREPFYRALSGFTPNPKTYTVTIEFYATQPPL